MSELFSKSRNESVVGLLEDKLLDLLLEVDELKLLVLLLEDTLLELEDELLDLLLEVEELKLLVLLLEDMLLELEDEELDLLLELDGLVVIEERLLDEDENTLLLLLDDEKALLGLEDELLDLLEIDELELLALLLEDMLVELEDVELDLLLELNKLLTEALLCDAETSELPVCPAEEFDKLKELLELVGLLGLLSRVAELGVLLARRLLDAILEIEEVADSPLAVATELEAIALGVLLVGKLLEVVPVKPDELELPPAPPPHALKMVHSKMDGAKRSQMKLSGTDMR